MAGSSVCLKGLLMDWQNKDNPMGTFHIPFVLQKLWCTQQGIHHEWLATACTAHESTQTLPQGGLLVAAVGQ